MLASVASAQTGTGLTGKYYGDISFGSLKTTRTDPTIDFDWGSSIPSGTALTSGDYFSVAWSGQIEPEFSELYTFILTADNQGRLWVDDQLIVARTFRQDAGEMRGQIRLKAGHKVNIRVEFMEERWDATAKLEWASQSQPRQVVPSNRLYPSTAAPNGGSVLREVWTGIPGSAITTLTSNANYPAKPASREFLTSFECLAKNWEDSFGSRVTGYIRPEVTGSYTFAVSGDDAVQFYLSSDSNPANKSLAASVTSATGFRQWDAQPSQVSTARTLTAGKAYYVELLHKEDSGADHWSVGWKTPGDADFSIIPGTALMQPGTVTSQPSSSLLFDSLATEQPRLGVSRERFIWLKQMWLSPESSQAKSRAQQVINAADRDLNAAPDNGRYGQDRLQRLALAWWLTDDPKYPEYAWTNIIKYAIDTGDWSDPWKGLTNGLVAVGYDWFHPYWSQARKDEMRAKMVANFQSWTTSYSNNIGIILNSGHLKATLAVGTADSSAEGKCSSAIGRLNGYLDDWDCNAGAWFEGTDYGIFTKWGCGQALPAMEMALGSTYGLSMQAGLSTTAREPLFIASNAKHRFTFSDVGTGSHAAIGWANWWARRYDAPEVFYYSRAIGISALSTLLMPEQPILPGQAGLKPDFAGRGPADASPDFYQEVVTMREKWDDTNAIWVGCMGGADGVLSHDMMQSGTFQLSARGKRWFWDLSSESYDVPNHNVHTPNPSGLDRWDYYRNRAEAHNTIVINPDGGPDRVYDSSTRALLTNFQSTPFGRQSFATFDLTPKIQGATRVQRGFQLLGNRKQLIVQDEIVMPAVSNVWWFANFQNTSTTAAIDAEGTGVMLTQGSERLWCRILNGGGTWTVRAAEPLPTSPNPADNSPNPNYSKLAINLTGVTDATLAVWFVPLAPGESPPSVEPAITPLASWNLANNEAPVAQDGGTTSEGSAEVEVDLRTLASDDWTPATELAFAVGNAVGGSVTLLGDGHTARFTPAAGVNGAESFTFTATDADGATGNAATFSIGVGTSTANWIGTADGEWSVGANWLETLPPAGDRSADIRFFDGRTLDVETITAHNDLAGTTAVNRLTLAGTGTPSTVVNLTGNPLRMERNGPSAPAVSFGGPSPGVIYQISNAITLSETTSFDGAGAGTFVFQGPISGNGGITRTGDGGTLVLAGENHYSGPTTISAGCLRFDNPDALYQNNGALWTASNLIVGSGATAAFRVGGPGGFTDSDIDALLALGTDTGGFLNGSLVGLDTTGAPGGEFTYASAIANPNAGANSLGLVKLGSGTLTLTATNTCTGGTTVAEGTLVAAASGTLPIGDLTVADGATCEIRNPSGAVADSAVVRLSQSAVMNIAGGVNEIVKRIYIDGVWQAAGRWDAARDPNHFAGAGGLIALEGNPALSVTATWTGASGTDIDWSTAGNWTTGPPFGGDIKFTANGVAAGSAVTSVVDTIFPADSLNFAHTNTGNHTVRLDDGAALIVNGSFTPTSGLPTSVLFGIPNNSGTLASATYFTGTGRFLVDNPSAHFLTGYSNASGTPVITVNMSGLSEFSANTGIFGVGRKGTTDADTTRQQGGVLYLAKNSSITASQVAIGDTTSINGVPGVWTNGGTSTLYLGVGGDASNTIRTDAIDIGIGKAAGNLRFSNAQSTDAVTIRAANGSGAVGNVNVGYRNMSSSSATPTGTIDFGAGRTDALISNLYLGRWGSAAGGSGASPAGTLTTGTNPDSAIYVTNAYLGLGESTSSPTNPQTVTGTINIKGGVFSVGKIHLATGSSSSKVTRTANLTVNGGTFRFANIVSPTTYGSANIRFESGVVATYNSAARTFPLPYSLGATGGGTTLVFGEAAGGTGAITLAGAGTLLGDTTVRTVRDTTLTGGLGGAFALAKSGPARLTLNAANTYSGATNVNEGTLELGASGTISNSPAVSIAAGATLDVTAKSSFTLAGSQPVTFGLDSSGAGSSGQILANGLTISSAVVDFSISGTLNDAVYVLATYSPGNLTGSAFASVTPPAGYSLDYAYDGGTRIALVSDNPPTAFASWISGFSVGGQDQAGDDPDRDDIANLLEFVLDGNPAVADASILPSLNVTATDYEFTYRRRDASLSPDIIQIFQYGATPSVWTDVIVPAASGTVGTATITVADGSPADTVTIRIPKTEALDGKLFGRLKIMKQP